MIIIMILLLKLPLDQIYANHAIAIEACEPAPSLKRARLAGAGVGTVRGQMGGAVVVGGDSGGDVLNCNADQGSSGWRWSVVMVMVMMCSTAAAGGAGPTEQMVEDILGVFHALG